MQRNGFRLGAVGWAVLGGALALVTVRADDAPAYKNARLPVEARVADLLGRMTLDEKIAQLGSIWGQKAQAQDEKGVFDPLKAKKVLGNGIGQVSRPSEVRQSGGPWRTAREAATYVNAVQKFLIEETRLGIPAMFHEEAVHGFAALGPRSSPCPLASPAPGTPPRSRR